MNKSLRPAALAVAAALCTQVHAQSLQITDAPAADPSASAPAVGAKGEGGTSGIETSHHRGFIRCYQRGVRVVDEEVFGEPTAPNVRLDAVRLLAGPGHRLTLMPIGDSLCLVKTPARQVQVSGGTLAKSSSAARVSIAVGVEQ